MLIRFCCQIRFLRCLSGKGWLLKSICPLLTLLPFIFSNSTLAEEINYGLFKPPGELVPIGTHRLHIYCKGTGSPTVIIDAGLGSSSLEWKNIHDGISQNVRICIYDRAGYGWSDVGPLPRTSKQIADELYFLIDAKKLPDPYILVGHSFGGYNMRYFANEHPELVAGIVLVDSSHPDQFERLHLKETVIRKVNHPKTFSYTVSQPVMHANYPKSIKNLAFRLLTNYKSHTTRLNELENFRVSAKQVALANAIPNVPLLVLTRGKRVWPNDERGDQMEAAWEAMQAELSYLSTISIQVVAKESGHSIHLDQPELVSSSILNTINAARKLRVQHYAKTNESRTNFVNFYPDTASQYYFDFPMLGAYVNYANNTLYYDQSAYAVNTH